MEHVGDLPQPAAGRVEGTQPPELTVVVLVRVVGRLVGIDVDEQLGTTQPFCRRAVGHLGESDDE